MNSSEFLVDSSELLDDVLRTVEAHWLVIREPGSVSNLTFLDTFDWRLFRAGRMLYATRCRGIRELTLSTRDGDVQYRLAGVGTPVFARDLPPGPLSEVITAAVEPRRLFPLVQLKAHEKTVRILNSDQKTVVRLIVQVRTASQSGRGNKSKPLPAVVRVVPVKGYHREHDGLLALLVGELGLEAVPEGAYASAMEAAGLTPGDYKSKLAIPLSPDMRADEAAKAIHHTLMDTMLANTDGVRRNLDSEFLHEYRVAVRRTRSALRQIKGVFPDSAVQHFSNEFKWLGAATGPVRDLDVYLLKMEDFRAELPEDIRAHLEPLDNYLQVHHVKEQRRLVRALASARYRTLLDDWSRFLNQPPHDNGACYNAAQPVIESAADRIWSAYRRVYKQGSAIEPQTPAEPLHALRIECKKLRYLLEFFVSLYPPREMRELIESLKRLQSNLGDFNDCEVQQLTLRRFANEMSEESVASADSLLAMGRLMDDLLRQQFDERQRFESCFAHFSLPDNRERYRRLFKSSGKGAR